MSTSSQHLGLTVPDESDPFERTDFVHNYNTLDASPGTLICTSTTRPAWGANQAGMSIWQTDTRSQLLWTGTAWHEPQQTAPAWFSALNPGATLAFGQTVTYTLGTLSLRKPGSLVVMIQANVGRTRPKATSIDMIPLINNTYAGNYAGNFEDKTQWGESASDADYNDYNIINTVGLRSLAAGTHTAGVRLGIGAEPGSHGVITNIRLLAFLVNSTDV